METLQNSPRSNQKIGRSMPAQKRPSVSAWSPSDEDETASDTEPEDADSKYAAANNNNNNNNYSFAPQDDEDLGLTVSEGDDDIQRQLHNEYPLLMQYLGNDLGISDSETNTVRSGAHATSDSQFEGFGHDDDDFHGLTSTGFEDNNTEVDEEDEDDDAAYANIDADSDDASGSTEAEEEHAIRQTFKAARPRRADDSFFDGFSPEAEPLAEPLAEQFAEPEPELGSDQGHDFDAEAEADESESESEDESDLDALFAPVNRSRPSMPDSRKRQAKAEEDDSFLWAYFFSSSDEENEAVLPPALHPGLHMEGEEDSLGISLGFGPPSQQTSTFNSQSGDSTDEEPQTRPTKRAPGQRRAVEVLSADTLSARPPVLGQWSLAKAHGHVGIIDGLTTRTLSPPPDLGPNNDSESEQNDKFFLYGTVGSPRAAGSPIRAEKRPSSELYRRHSQGGYENALTSEESSDELVLDDFINTEELGSGSESEMEPRLHKRQNSMSRREKVPLYAFRNRSSPYQVNLHPQQNYQQSVRDRATINPRSRRRSTLGSRESVAQSVRSIRRHAKRLRGPSQMGERDRVQHEREQRERERELAREFATQDLLEELAKAGAIAPLFDLGLG